jgi:Zinc finger, C2H2 type
MATRATKAKATTPATDGLTCPECGKTFTRAAALGAHRKMTHGVAGTSKNATGKRTNAAVSRKRRTTTTSRSRSTTAATNGGAQPVDRDALLRTLFPAGIPPRQDVIEAVSDWLKEAERLARSR